MVFYKTVLLIHIRCLTFSEIVAILSAALDLPCEWKVYNPDRGIRRTLLKIGELAKATGLSTKTIRFYEGEGLI